MFLPASEHLGYDLVTWEVMDLLKFYHGSRIVILKVILRSGTCLHQRAFGAIVLESWFWDLLSRRNNRGLTCTFLRYDNRKLWDPFSLRLLSILSVVGSLGERHQSSVHYKRATGAIQPPKSSEICTTWNGGDYTQLHQKVLVFYKIFEEDRFNFGIWLARVYQGCGSASTT